MGGDTSAADPDWPKGCPLAYGIYSAIESGVQMEKVRDIQSDSVYLSKKLLYVMSPASLRAAEHLCVAGKQWLNSLLFVLYLKNCAGFALLPLSLFSILPRKIRI